jgi:hypothetical protein
MSLSFETRSLSVGQLLSGTSVFRMPAFQRPYSWTEDTGAQLFDDIQTAFNHLDTVGDQTSKDVEYFLGTLVVSQSGATAPFDVVDGQQRLVSLSAIIAILRDQLPTSNQREELQQHLFRSANEVKGTAASARVKLRDLDQDQFAAWVHGLGGTNQLPRAGDTDSCERLLRSIRRIKEDLGRVQHTYVAQLARFLLNNCHFILITTRSLEDAYKLFRSINSSGQPLSELDVARAELIGPKVHESAEALKLAEAWDAVEGQLGVDGLQNYVRTVIGIANPGARELPLYDALREIIRNPHQLTAFRTGLSRFLSSYLDLDDANLKFGADGAKINRLIKCLLRLYDADWRPAALLWLTNPQSAPKTYQFFHALDGLCLGMHILEYAPAKRAKRFAQVQQRIAAGTVLDALASEIYLSDREKHEIQEILKNPIPANRKYLKTLLLRLSAEMCDGAAEPHFPEGLTLEHVLPQKPARNSVWLHVFPDEAARKQLSEQLGNYALLTHKINSKAQNSPFPEKKKIYFSTTDNQSFPITNELTNYNEWHPDAILGRSKKFVALAGRILNPL